MYLNAETQEQILLRMHFALRERGVLMLGKAEMLLAHSDLFTPLDLPQRIFEKGPEDAPRERHALRVTKAEAPPSAPTDVRLGDYAFDSGAVAQLVVNQHGRLGLVSQRAREVFGLSTLDIGRPIQDLEVSYRPVEIRSVIEQVLAERRPTVIKSVERSRPDGAIFYDVHVAPVTDRGGVLLGTQVSFVDISAAVRLEQELRRANAALEVALEAVQSTNEELETTNEELQSTVEELETTNEELQSTNEELETMNEELQSTNEELQTLNDELRVRGEELGTTNVFLETILATLRSAVIVLDRELHVRVWNGQAQDMWGLRPDEVLGKSLLGLDIGLPIDKLTPTIRACFSAEERAGDFARGDEPPWAGDRLQGDLLANRRERRGSRRRARDRRGRARRVTAGARARDCPWARDSAIPYGENMDSRWGIAGASVALAACRSPTQITVTVETDLPCADVTATSLTAGELGAIETGLPTSESASCAADGQLGTVVLVPSGSDNAQVAFKVITALNHETLERCAGASAANDTNCIVARRALRYLPHTPLTVIVSMSQACEGIVCDANTTCVNGACQSATIDPSQCAGAGCALTGPGTGDAGLDATVSDATTDAPAAEGSAPDASAGVPGCDLGGLQAGAAWPMEGYCPSGRYRSPLVGPASAPVHKWRWVGGELNVSPWVAADGTLYVASLAGTVTALSPGDGESCGRIPRTATPRRTGPSP